MTGIGRDVSLSHPNIGKSTQVSRWHSLYHCPEISLRSPVSPNTNEKHPSRHLWTLHAPEASCEVNLSTRVFGFACSSSVHSSSMRCEFSFVIRTSGFPLASFDSDHLLIIQGFAIIIIRCAPSCPASLLSVQRANIKLFTVDYNASAPCISITVLSSGSSGTPGNSHSVW